MGASGLANRPAEDAETFLQEQLKLEAAGKGKQAHTHTPPQITHSNKCLNN